jgi:Protein of unknown function (DUF2934)
MAKPRAPKKNVGGQEIVSAAITPTPVPTQSAASATAPVPPTQASKPETLQTEQKKTEARKAEPKRVNGKPEIFKTESRSNLVPINMDEEIRRLAYLLAERRGFEPGHEAEDWLAAETEIRQRYRQQSA